LAPVKQKRGDRKGNFFAGYAACREEARPLEPAPRTARAADPGQRLGKGKPRRPRSGLLAALSLSSAADTIASPGRVIMEVTNDARWLRCLLRRLSEVAGIGAIVLGAIGVTLAAGPASSALTVVASEAISSGRSAS
jgi:hypothetical protein